LGLINKGKNQHRCPFGESGTGIQTTLVTGFWRRKADTSGCRLLPIAGLNQIAFTALLTVVCQTLQSRSFQLCFYSFKK
jgi:hypothetical protein